MKILTQYDDIGWVWVDNQNWMSDEEFQKHCLKLSKIAFITGILLIGFQQPSLAATKTKKFSNLQTLLENEKIQQTLIEKTSKDKFLEEVIELAKNVADKKCVENFQAFSKTNSLPEKTVIDFVSFSKPTFRPVPGGVFQPFGKSTSKTVIKQLTNEIASLKQEISTLQKLRGGNIPWGQMVNVGLWGWQLGQQPAVQKIWGIFQQGRKTGNKAKKQASQNSSIPGLDELQRIAGFLSPESVGASWYNPTQLVRIWPIVVAIALGTPSVREKLPPIPFLNNKEEKRQLTMTELFLHYTSFSQPYIYVFVFIILVLVMYFRSQGNAVTISSDLYKFAGNTIGYFQDIAKKSQDMMTSAVNTAWKHATESSTRIENFQNSEIGNLRKKNKELEQFTEKLASKNTECAVAYNNVVSDYKSCATEANYLKHEKNRWRELTNTCAVENIGFAQQLPGLLTAPQEGASQEPIRLRSGAEEDEVIKYHYSRVSDISASPSFSYTKDQFVAETQSLIGEQPQSMTQKIGSGMKKIVDFITFTPDENSKAVKWKKDNIDYPSISFDEDKESILFEPPSSNRGKSQPFLPRENSKEPTSMKQLAKQIDQKEKPVSILVRGWNFVFDVLIDVHFADFPQQLTELVQEVLRL